MEQETSGQTITERARFEGSTLCRMSASMVASHGRTEPHVAGKRTYFPELDGVRALAIAMVMLFHLPEAGIHLPSAVMFGQTGVDLFFVLSGFLITGILLKAQQNDWHEVRTFYIRRTLRIFPLYYGALLLLWMGMLHRHVSWDVWLYLQSFSLAFMRDMQGPNHFWSLSVEEQFYLVWPFVVLFLPRRRLPATLALLFLTALFLRVWTLRYGVAVFYWTPTRMDALVAGAYVAWLQYTGRLTESRRVAYAVLAGSLALLVLCSYLLRYGHYWPQVFKYTAYAGLYASVIALVLTQGAGLLRSCLSSKPLRSIGRISYGLYVVHPFVYYEVLTHTPANRPLLRASAGILISIAAACISWFAFEKHLLALKSRIAPERTRFPVGAQSVSGS